MHACMHHLELEAVPQFTVVENSNRVLISASNAADPLSPWVEKRIVNRPIKVHAGRRRGEWVAYQVLERVYLLLHPD